MSKREQELRNYCVYEHCDDYGEVFFVGAGKPKRPFNYWSGRSSHWKQHVEKHCASGKPVIKILRSNLDQMSAYTHTRFWIEVYGRKDLGKGSLVNLTDGGIGARGCIRTEEAKKHLSKINKGKKLSKESKDKISKGNKGKVLSEESKDKISKANKGRKHSLEAIANMRASRWGKHKISYKNQRGIKHTPERIANMRAGQKRAKELKSQKLN